VTGLQFVAAIVNSVAWPTAVVVAAGLLRRELPVIFQRTQPREFPAEMETFAGLTDYETMFISATGDPAAPDAEAVVRYEVAEFSVVKALISAAPGQAVIDAWGLLEYQLNVASDRLAPDQPHGWPQVSNNLRTWDEWPRLYPAVQELRRLRDSTVRSGQSPSSADADRYVSVARDVATAVRTAFPPGDEGPGEAR
jgi:hypothetical protein